MVNGQTTERKVPIRRCTGCGQHFEKNALIRVLRTPDGQIVIDETGKKSGRGAYICKSAECFKKARKSRRLEAGLDCRVPDEVYDRLEGELNGGK